MLMLMKIPQQIDDPFECAEKYIGSFEEWSDKKIHAGQHWKEEIKGIG